MAARFDPREKSVMRQVIESADRMTVVARNAEAIEGRGNYQYEMLVEDIRKTQAEMVTKLNELRELWTKMDQQGKQLQNLATIAHRNLGSALNDAQTTLGTILDRIEGRGGRSWGGQRRQVMQ